MEFSFAEVGDCIFTIKELHQGFFQVNFDIGFHEIYRYSESNYSAPPITLRQLPCRSNNFCLLNNRTPFSISRSEVFL